MVSKARALLPDCPQEDDRAATVEQRCARIRGRMVWILSQIEGSGHAEPASSSVGEIEACQLHEQRFEKELRQQAVRHQMHHSKALEAELSRQANAFASKLTAVRTELDVAKEAVRQARTAADNVRLECERRFCVLEATRSNELDELHSRISLLELCQHESDFGAEGASAGQGEKLRPAQPSLGGVPQATLLKPERQSPLPPPCLSAKERPREQVLASTAAPAIRSTLPNQPPNALSSMQITRKNGVPSAIGPTDSPTTRMNGVPPAVGPTDSPNTGASRCLGVSSLTSPSAVVTEKLAAHTTYNVANPGVLAKAGGMSQPAPHGPCLVPQFYAYTHPGGSKDVGATNQDTWFHLKIDDYNAVFGVFDGHGSENGSLVAQVSADAIKAHLAENFSMLRAEPETVFSVAFERAHEAARTAVMETNHEFKLINGVPVDEYALAMIRTQRTCAPRSIPPPRFALDPTGGMTKMACTEKQSTEGPPRPSSPFLMARHSFMHRWVIRMRLLAG